MTNTDDMVALGSVTYSLKDASAAADEVAVVTRSLAEQLPEAVKAKTVQ